MQFPDRYSRILTFINGCPHPMLKKLMKAELNRQQNCCIAHASCNHDCGPCLYYGEGWAPMVTLIDRVSNVNGVSMDVWKSQFKLLLTTIRPCTNLLKEGECNGNCSSCGL